MRNPLHLASRRKSKGKGKSQGKGRERGTGKGNEKEKGSAFWERRHLACKNGLAEDYHSVAPNPCGVSHRSGLMRFGKRRPFFALLDVKGDVTDSPDGVK
ncbi:MAG: hypothetical protein D6679_02915 [Candidatus Hydrogenedentota bacterium]|nr:MAG: hypothetical protein D6679_02915 [Candidatus Hydrogenedentota bacterium]